MSLHAHLKSLEVDDALDLAAKALDTIGALASAANGHSAADVVMAIRHIYSVLTGGEHGTDPIHPDVVRGELQKFLDGLHDNDTAADAAAAKLPSKD